MANGKRKVGLEEGNKSAADEACGGGAKSSEPVKRKRKHYTGRAKGSMKRGGWTTRGRNWQWCGARLDNSPRN